ncbi:hypothetical protein B566_EDAN018327 [Ephemera danica]|nr:hypothetical protein B566_EDAN018327 [Ephemera danica]
MVPSTQRVALGENALLECQPPRGHPEPVVTWKKNGQTLELVLYVARFRLVDGGSLAIQDVRPSDDGRYQCVAKNQAGNRETPPANLRKHV